MQPIQALHAANAGLLWVLVPYLYSQTEIDIKYKKEKKKLRKKKKNQSGSFFLERTSFFFLGSRAALNLSVGQ